MVWLGHQKVSWGHNRELSTIHLVLSAFRAQGRAQGWGLRVKTEVRSTHCVTGSRKRRGELISPRRTLPDLSKDLPLQADRTCWAPGEMTSKRGTCLKSVHGKSDLQCDTEKPMPHWRLPSPVGGAPPCWPRAGISSSGYVQCSLLFSQKKSCQLKLIQELNDFFYRLR